MMSFLTKIKFPLLLTLLSFTLLAACTVKVPSEVIQPEEMENLLYDYHLMQSMAAELNSSEQYKRKLYEQYVFDKHHVTEAQFDSSLVWYMRHTRELEEIYKRLNTRFVDKKEELANHLPPNERIRGISPEGDTVNVWDDFRLMRLTTSPIANKLVFEFNSDSNYHMRDSIEWKMNVRFLGDTAKARAVMALTMLLDKDTIGQSRDITQSGDYSLSVACDSNYKLRNLYGHVYYYLRNGEEQAEGSADTDSLYEYRVLPVGDLLLSDIKLMRYHRKETLRTDTTTVAEQTETEKEE